VNGGDSLISVEKGAERLGVSPDWIYRRSKDEKRLPFLIRIGGKLLCSSLALDRYIQQRVGR
jgi:predicted DNA-binding transcriptional regulator AlpA